MRVPLARGCLGQASRAGCGSVSNSALTTRGPAVCGEAQDAFFQGLSFVANGREMKAMGAPLVPCRDRYESCHCRAACETSCRVNDNVRFCDCGRNCGRTPWLKETVGSYVISSRVIGRTVAINYASLEGILLHWNETTEMWSVT